METYNAISFSLELNEALKGKVFQIFPEPTRWFGRSEVTDWHPLYSTDEEESKFSIANTTPWIFARED